MRVVGKRLSTWVAVASLAFGGASSEAAFEVTGEGARPMSLGGAYVAGGHDVNALWYNPAGIVVEKKREVYVSAAPRIFPGLTEDISQRSAGFIGHIARGWGIGGALSLVDGGEFYNEMVFLGSIAFPVSERLDIGVSGKFFRWQSEPASAESRLNPRTGETFDNAVLDSRSGTAIDFDAGLSVSLGAFRGVEELRFGFALRNLLGSTIADDGGREDAAQGRLGETMEGGGGNLLREWGAGFVFDLGSNAVLVAAEGFGDEVELRGGLEVTSGTGGPAMLAIRGGAGGMISDDGGGGDIDLGLGVVIENLRVDYALILPVGPEDLGRNQRVSVGIEF